jgi:hypothetical protein
MYKSKWRRWKSAEKNKNRVKNKGYLLPKTKAFNRRGRGGRREKHVL